MDASRDRLGNLAGIRRGRRRLGPGRGSSSRPATRGREPDAGLLGAGLIGLAFGLTAIPLFWLGGIRAPPAGRVSRRLGAGGSPRGVGCVVVALFVALRLQGAFQLPIALFVLTMVVDRRGDPVGGALTIAATGASVTAELRTSIAGDRRSRSRT